MKLVYGLAGTLVLAVAVLLLANLVDEDLIPEAAAILDEQPAGIPAAENLYVAVVGFDVDGAEPPHVLGQRLLDAYRAGSATGQPPGSFHERTGTKLIAFSLERDGLKPLCLDFEDGHDRCLPKIAALGPQLDRHLADNATLLARYRQLRQYPRFDPEFTGIEDPIPPWRGIFATRRLYLTDLARRTAGAGAAAAVEALAEDHAFWRRVARQHDLTLLDRMVINGHLRNSFILLGELLRAGRVPKAAYRAARSLIEPWTPAELSLQRALEIEFRGGARYLQGAPESLLGRGDDEWGAFATWIAVLDEIPFARVLFLPRATVNRYFATLKPDIERAGGPCRDAAQGEGSARPGGIDWLRNPLGAAAVHHQMPRYGSYVARQCDLEGMRRLVALQLDWREAGGRAGSLEALLAAAGEGATDPHTGAPLSVAGGTLAFAASDKRVRALMPWPL